MAGFQDFSSWMDTPGGRGTVNAVGAGLQTYGNYQQNKQNARQNAQQFAANTRQQDYWSQQATDTNRANSVLNADPLGADQKYAQRNALMAAILPNMRNFRSQPGDPGVAQAMGGDRGGVMNALPQGGFDPSMINAMFGSQSTMNAIAQRHQNLTNLAPRAATPDLGSLYGAEADPVMQQMQAYAQKAQTADASEKAAYDQQINQLIQQEAAKDPSGSGKWHKLARIAGVVGGVAAMALTMGAASPIVAPIIAGAAGGLGAWGKGQNPLMGAVVGAGASYAANGGLTPSTPGASSIRNFTSGRLPGAALGAPV